MTGLLWGVRRMWAVSALTPQSQYRKPSFPRPNKRNCAKPPDPARKLAFFPHPVEPLSEEPFKSRRMPETGRWRRKFLAQKFHQGVVCP
jgi:hypothetical protein